MQDNTKCQCSPSPESPSNNTKCQDGVASKQASTQARLPSVQARRLYRCACCAAILRPQAAVYSYGTTAAHTRVLLYRLRVNEKVRGIALVGLSVKGGASRNTAHRLETETGQRFPIVPDHYTQFSACAGQCRPVPVPVCLLSTDKN